MVDLEKVRKFFIADRFAMEQGIVIEEAEEGYAKCTVIPNEHHLNAGGAVQGGLTFTLADFAFAVASNCTGSLTVSLENNISFIAPPKGKMTAIARVVRETKSVAFCDVEVFDETQKIIAKMSVTGYKKGKIEFQE